MPPPPAVKHQILNEFCAATGYHRKSAIRALQALPPRTPRRHRRQTQTYGSQTIAVLAAIWEAAGYPWSRRLKALLPLWLPWAKRRLAIPPQVERQLLTIGPATIDRRLQPRKRQLQRRLYGRTKPGTLLKHHIPIKTERWETTAPGFVEADLVSHSGNSADGEFTHSLNFTDIHTTWWKPAPYSARASKACARRWRRSKPPCRLCTRAWTPTTVQSLSTTTSTGTARGNLILLRSHEDARTRHYFIPCREIPLAYCRVSRSLGFQNPF